MRDHLYSGFAGLCPMAPCRHGKPPVAAEDASGSCSRLPSRARPPGRFPCTHCRALPGADSVVESTGWGD